MRGVEADAIAPPVLDVRGTHARDQLLGSDAFFFGTQHDGGAVGVVGANVVAAIALHFLKAHPDICLNIFNQMAQMDAAVCVRQGRGDQYFSGLDLIGFCCNSAFHNCLVTVMVLPL